MNNDLNIKLNSIIDLIKSLGFEDISDEKIIKYQKIHETNTYHRYDVIITIKSNLVDFTISYIHQWGYGLDKNIGYTYDSLINEQTGLFDIIKFIKEDFSKELRKLKIQKLLA